MTGSKFSVRAAKSSDAKAAAEVHCASAMTAFVGIFPPEAQVPTPENVLPEWSAIFNDPASSMFVGLDGDRIIGTGGISPDPGVESGVVLACFYVHPDYWGRGVGTLLYKKAMEIARASGLTELNLWVLEGNPRSRKMYEKQGWNQVPGEVRLVGDTQVLDVLYHRRLT